MDFIVRAVTPDDWRETRALRLEMLADTPIAFTETLETALQRTEREWRARAARHGSTTSVRFAAVAGDGRWIGTMGAYTPVGVADPVLVGVYVSPGFRGETAGVTDALLGAVESWARQRARGLSLLVHERNARAQAAYRKRGFVPTGRSEPYLLNPAERDIEMFKTLTPTGAG